MTFFYFLICCVLNVFLIGLKTMNDQTDCSTVLYLNWFLFPATSILFSYPLQQQYNEMISAILLRWSHLKKAYYYWWCPGHMETKITHTFQECERALQKYCRNNRETGCLWKKEISRRESCSKKATCIMGYEELFARLPWGWGWKINGITYVSHSENSATVNRKAR